MLHYIQTSFSWAVRQESASPGASSEGGECTELEALKALLATAFAACGWTEPAAEGEPHVEMTVRPALHHVLKAIQPS